MELEHLLFSWTQITEQDSHCSWIKLGARDIHPATPQTKPLLSKEHSFHLFHIFNHQDASNGSPYCQASVGAGSLCQTTGGGWLLSGCLGRVPLSRTIYALHIGQMLVVSPPPLSYSLLTAVFPKELNPWVLQARNLPEDQVSLS